MTDEVVVINSETGARELVQLGYMLPSYDLGQWVVYKATDKSNAEIESSIVGIDLSVSVKDGVVHSDVVYELENGDSIYQDEITSFYPREAEENVAEFEVGDEVMFTSNGVTGTSKIKYILECGRCLLENGYSYEQKNLAFVISFKYSEGDKVKFYDGSDLVEATITSKRKDGDKNNYLTSLGYWIEEEDIVEI